MAVRACGNSRDLRVMRTNGRLKEAFIKLLGQKPYDQITVQEICEKAAVRRTTFYQHFQDKQDFLAWFIGNQQHEFTAFAIQDISPDDLDEYYARVIRNLLKYLKENEKMVRLLLRAGVEGQLLIAAFSQACIRDVTSHLESIPDIDKKLGGVPIPFLAEFYIGGLVAAARWWLSQEQPCTEEEMARYIRWIINHGKNPPLREEK